MTLIEVMIAITILTTAMLSISSYMSKFARTTSASQYREVANELASGRIEEVKGGSQYSAIDSVFAGTESFKSGRYKGFTRTTIVKREGGGSNDIHDYTTVTVIIDSPYFESSVRKTSVIAAF